MKVVDFTIEYRTNPLGFDEPRPRFSWKLVSSARNVTQKSYKLSVYDGKESVWNGGAVKSGASVLVPYGGEPFKPQTEYRATVEVTDNYGETADAELYFETGLQCGGAFRGRFIAPDTAEQLDVSTVFTNFSVTKEIAKARLYVTALGMYKAEINGRKAGDLYFAPFWTSYNDILQYQTYDVTPLLVCGANELSLTLAKGWYRGYIGWGANKYGNTSAALAELHIFYADGTRAVIAADKTWRARKSYITASEIYDGETQDFTADLSETYPVKEIVYDKTKIAAQTGEPCRATQRLKPVGYIVTPKGKRVLDFGQNLTGLAELTVSGKKGQTVKLRHAEVLDPQGNFYTENLRGIKAADTFVLAGGTQTLRAEFTFHGFRYIEVTGIEDINPEDFTALVIHSDLKKTGNIVTSDETANRFLLNVEWGQRGNFVDVPTDCPQRDERLGWTADANAFFVTAAYQYDVALFFRKWLKDLAFCQHADGLIPWVIPDVKIGGGDGGFDAFWADAATMVPFNFYRMYGDKSILEAQYPSMRKFVDGISGMCNGAGLVARGHQFGDWVALDKDEFTDGFTGLTDVYFLANAFYIVSLRIMLQTAKILGNKTDAEYYKKRLAAVQKAFLREYVTPSGRLAAETQTAYVIALHFRLVPENYRPKIAAALKANLERRKGKLTTGFIGAPFLCFALADAGLNEECEKLLLSREYPSWLYPVTRGATTVWERWNGITENGELYNPAMNSFNHYAYGSVKEFYFRRVAGIDCLEAGFKKILIKPMPLKGLSFVRAEYDGAYGLIRSEYERKNGKLFFKLEIPANTTARIVLPDGSERSAGSGVYEFEIEEGLSK